MEYGVVIDGMERYENKVGCLNNDKYTRHALHAVGDCSIENILFSKKNIKTIGDFLTEKMKCLGRNITFTERTIISAINSVLTYYRPQLGDMYFMYNIPAAEKRNDLKSINEQVIELIYSQLKLEYEIEENNKKLTIWTSLLGDFNEHGLRQYSTIKTNNKPINKLRFNMNY